MLELFGVSIWFTLEEIFLLAAMLNIRQTWKKRPDKGIRGGSPLQSIPCLIPQRHFRLWFGTDRTAIAGFDVPVCIGSFPLRQESMILDRVPFDIACGA